MIEYLAQTWAIIVLIFYLPYLLLYAIYHYLRSKILNEKMPDNSNRDYPKSALIGSVIFWIALITVLLYNDYTKIINYVYACPDGSSSKCYLLRADISKEDGNVFVEKIYFDNGGHIDFDYCDFSNSKGTCYTNDENWEIEISNQKDKAINQASLLYKAGKLLGAN